MKNWWKSFPTHAIKDDVKIYSIDHNTTLIVTAKWISIIILTNNDVLEKWLEKFAKFAHYRPFKESTTETGIYSRIKCNKSVNSLNSFINSRHSKFWDSSCDVSCNCST